MLRKSAMNTGQQYPVSVTMRNTGSRAWTAQEAYRLGSQNPRDNLNWGLGRVDVPSVVEPGQEVTFAFTVTAPNTPGVYAFQWMMLQEGVEWFGDFTPDVSIRVTRGMTTVPDVREMTREVAASEIRTADLVPEFTGASAPNAWVWAQSPTGGVIVDRGSTVRLQLTTGPIP